MTEPRVSGGGDPDLAQREQLTSLQGLLALAMRMTDSGDEQQILRLAATAVPSIARCRLLGAHLHDDGWYLTSGDAAGAHLLAEVQTQLAVVNHAGGAVAVGREAWGWAFPLRSLGGHFGFLVVAAAAEPSSGEQFLLRVLAQQAGVALANARLHTHQRRQAAELLGTNTRLAETISALERSTAIHDRLTRVAEAGESQKGIAEAVYELTGFPVAIEDRHGNLRAWAGPGCPDPYPKEAPGERELMVRNAMDAAAPVHHHGRLMAVAHPRDDVVGLLALIDPEEIAGDDARVALEHGATVLSMDLARLAGIIEVELRVRRDLVDELLAGTDDEASAIARAEALGYDLERPHRVVVVEAQGELDARLDLFNAVRRASRGCGVGSLLVTRGQTVVVLSDTDRRWEAVRSAVERELHGAPCRLGVGGRSDQIDDIPRSHQEATLALRILDLGDGRGGAVAFDDLGVYRLLAGLDDLTEVERFARRWLGDLLDYDARKESSELVTTLREYLGCGGNYDATAHALAVHRSTVKYRLQRIREISGHDLTSPETQFHLQFALRAQRTLGAMRAASA